MDYEYVVTLHFDHNGNPVAMSVVTKGGKTYRTALTLKESRDSAIALDKAAQRISDEIKGPNSN